MSSPHTKQPPEIITRFARQLGRKMAEYLINPEVSAQRHPLKDRFAIALMLILSKVKAYREELLFRDYRLNPKEAWQNDYIVFNGTKVTLSTESIFYVQAVLGRRLSIVSQHKSLPNNMHRLLLMLCRYSFDKHRLNTRIERLKDQTPIVNEAFFTRVADILKECLKQVNISPLSKTYREEYGILFLIAGQNRAELPEEMSLFDVMEAAPTPLDNNLQHLPVGFIPLLKHILLFLVGFIPLLEHILISLNGNYGLLRSLGLPPQKWQEKISDDHLKELKKLKKMADALFDSKEQQNQDSEKDVTKNLVTAYKQAFLELQHRNKALKKEGKKIKIAGFENFSDFVESPVGIALTRLKTECVSLSAGDDEDPPNYYEKTLRSQNSTVKFDGEWGNLPIDADDTHDINSAEEKNNALANLPIKSLSPLEAYFFQQAIVLQRPLTEENGVFNDEKFYEIAALDKKYQKLNDDKLETRLIDAIKTFIEKHRH